MSDNILKNAIEKIVDLANPSVYNIGGNNYSARPLYEVGRRDQEIDTHFCDTLEGLVELIRLEGVRYAEEGRPLFVQVMAYNNVKVYSSLEEDDHVRFRRLKLYGAVADVPGFKAGWRSQEVCGIELRSLCAANVGREYLLDLISSLDVREGVSSVDNGVTQEVTVRSGVQLKECVPVNPYVTLKPYRTFLEVEQPASEFLLRVDKEKGIGLFEADGGVWKLEAKRNIAAWLKERLADEIGAGAVVVTI